MSTLPANMTSPPAENRHSISERVYAWLLLAYPEEFRREYGSQMTQLFRDCCRAEHRRGHKFGFWRLWCYTLLDLFQTVPKEHFENLGKENAVMNNLRRDALALLGCLGIVVVAVLLLNYGRKNEVGAILVFGYALDALIMAGLVGNLIVFLLVKTTRLNSLRTAFWTFLVVNAAPVLALALVVGRSDPRFSLGNVLIGYVVSFLFWFGLHWMWSKSKEQLPTSDG